MRFIHFLFCSLLCLTLATGQSTAEDFFVCGTDDTDLPLDQGGTGGCAADTPWTDLRSYRPYDSAAPTLTVKVNCILLYRSLPMTEPDGRVSYGNFDFAITEDREFLENAFKDMNDRIRDLNFPDPTCHDPNDDDQGHFINNGRIQFDVEYYFVTDDYLWDIGNMNTDASYCPNEVDDTYLTHLEQVIIDENIRDGIHIIFGQEGIPYETIVNQRDFFGIPLNENGEIGFSNFASSTDCSQRPTFDLDRDLYVHMNNEYFAYRYKQIADEDDDDLLVSFRSFYQVGRVLIHELGHSLNLGHSCECAQNIMIRRAIGCYEGTDFLAMNHFTPTQLGTMHQTLHLRTTRRHVICEYPGDTPRRIIGNETWAFDTKMYNDVIVESGAELRICGDVFMPEQGRILIRPGARLVLDGARLSIDREELEYCPEARWNGIYVSGNPDRMHAQVDIFNLQADDPGVVLLQNQSLIERATVGISASNDLRLTNYEQVSVPGDSPFGNYLPGGIVQAENSTFLNNIIGVSLAYYSHPNISSFTDCTFTTDDGESDTGISALRVSGFTVRDCDFLSLTGAGVALNQATADILGGNLFQYCNTGVYAAGYSFFDDAIQIGEDTPERNEFLDNGLGIHLGNVSAAFVEHNFFEDNTTGMTLSGRSSFRVEDNEFIGGTSAIRAEQTGNGNFNRIDCNRFEEVGAGLYFLGDNRSVEFDGNDFSRVGEFQGTPNRDVGLYAAWINGSPNFGKLKSQGTQFFGAENTFRRAIDNNDSRDITTAQDPGGQYVTDAFIYYAFSTPDQVFVPECALNAPCPTEVNNYNRFEINTGSDPCPDGFTGGDGGDCEQPACLADKYTEIDNLRARWDNGQTAAYLTQLSSGNAQVYQSLAQYSPLVSDEVLQAVLLQSGISAGQKAQLLHDNVPLTRHTLDLAASWLTAAQLTTIEQQQRDQPAFTRIDLAKQVLEAEQIKNRALQATVVKAYQNNDLTTAYNVLNNDGSTLARRLHIDLLLWQDDRAGAQHQLDNFTDIEADYQLATQYLLNHPTGEWPPAVRTDLIALADQDGLHAGLAQSLLLQREAIYFLPPDEQPQALVTMPSNSDVTTPEIQVVETFNVASQVAPNPVLELLYVTLPTSEALGRVNIYALDGRLLKSEHLTGSGTIDVKGLPRGLVMVCLLLGDRVETFQIILQ